MSVRVWPRAIAFAGAAAVSHCATVPPGAPTIASRVPLTGWQDGDILLSGGSGWRSWVVRSNDSEHSPFSHAAIVSMVPGQPVMLIQSSPAEGHVGSLSMADYLAQPQLRNVAVYRPASAAEGAAAATEARRYLALAVPFDPEYDLRSDAQLYCTEMIWRSYFNVGIDLFGKDHTPLRPAAIFGPLIWPSDFTQMTSLHKVFSTVE